MLRDVEPSILVEMDSHSFTLRKTTTVAEKVACPEGDYTLYLLSVLDCSLVVLGLMCMLSILNAIDALPGESDSLLVLSNLMLASVFCCLFKYTDFRDGYYSLGKALLVSAHLFFYNVLLIFGLTHQISIPAILVVSAGFGSMALISGWYHFEFSQSYTTISTNSLYYRLEKKIKRLFDFSAAVIGLIAISPLLALCFAILSLESNGSPIFCQTRIGKDATPFRMFKFRSMIPNADRLIVEQKPVLHKWHDDPRITRLGKIIRKLSIDELPQLWNVVRGEMSLVGPRPPLPTEYELMNAYHRRKFEATPGLTGLWQVVGRVENQRDFNSVALYDTMYIENWCLIEDIKILLKTIPVVLLQKGAS